MLKMKSFKPQLSKPKPTMARNPILRGVYMTLFSTKKVLIIHLPGNSFLGGLKTQTMAFVVNEFPLWCFWMAQYRVQVTEHKPDNRAARFWINRESW